MAADKGTPRRLKYAVVGEFLAIVGFSTKAEARVFIAEHPAASGAHIVATLPKEIWAREEESLNAILPEDPNAGDEDS